MKIAGVGRFLGILMLHLLFHKSSEFVVSTYVVELAYTPPRTQLHNAGPNGPINPIHSRNKSSSTADMSWRCSSSSHCGLIANLKTNGIIKSQRVYDAMMKVDRAKYVQDSPYADSPQPIGYNATISAPHMHAFALEYLQDQLIPGNRALDVGSGTGYLATCMAEMVDVLEGGGATIGVDYVKPLVDMSVSNVRSDNPELLKNPRFRLEIGDGWKGGPAEFAPYHAIHVGAAASEIPQALVNQLAVGGKMIIPVDNHGFGQQLMLVTKEDGGKVTKQRLFGVSYVPLVKVDQGGLTM